MRMKTRKTVMAVLGAFILVSGKATGSEEHQHQQGQGGASQENIQMHSGAITFSDGKKTYQAKVLGGELGVETVDGIRVGLYVLQAESPERLKLDGRGPTHLFNATFTDEGAGRLLGEVMGSVVVAGERETLRMPLRPFESHFQALVRLPEPGEYTVSVHFSVPGHGGNTEPIAFTYRWPPSMREFGKTDSAPEAAPRDLGGSS